MAKMTETELKNLVDSEMTTAISGGQLAEERAKALDYYESRPFGDEQAGRSKVVIAEVQEVVDNLMPSLLRIFAVPDNTVEFDPVSEEDEEGAAQESDVVNHVFWKRNNGFMLIYNWLKDGLLQKNGFVECNWADDEKREREEYSGLDEVELAELLDDEDVEVVGNIIERPGTVIRDVPLPDGRSAQVVDEGVVFDVVIHRMVNKGRCIIDPIPPEEMKISEDATNMSLQDCRFAGRETTKTRGELIEMFPDKEAVIMDLPSTTDDVQDTEEERARDTLNQDTETAPSPPPLLQEIDVQIGFPRVDFDDDGVVEFRQVVVAGKQVLFNEAVDRRPYHFWTPLPMPHRFFGKCPADNTVQFQRVTSVLVRQMLDSLYLANNPEKAVWEQAIGDSTMDDLLTSRVGGIKRFTRPPQESVMPLNTEFVGAQSFPMLEWLDGRKKKLTGVGADTLGLEVDALKNIQQSVAAPLLDLSRLQIEAMARVFAETGLKSLFLHIHELLQKNTPKEIAFRIRNRWVKTDPTQWRNREDMTVLVGLGAGTREQKMMHLQGIAALQEKFISGGFGGILVSERNLFNMAGEFVKNALFPDARRFFQDPESAPALQAKQQKQQAQQADPAVLLAQQQLRQDAQEDQTERVKINLEHQRKMRELDIRAEEALTRMQKAADDFTAKLTEIEARFNTDIPGSLVK